MRPSSRLGLATACTRNSAIGLAHSRRATPDPTNGRLGPTCAAAAQKGAGGLLPTKTLIRVKSWPSVSIPRLQTHCHRYKTEKPGWNPKTQHTFLFSSHQPKSPTALLMRCRRSAAAVSRRVCRLQSCLGTRVHVDRSGPHAASASHGAVVRRETCASPGRCSARRYPGRLRLLMQHRGSSRRHHMRRSSRGRLHQGALLWCLLMAASHKGFFNLRVRVW